MNFPVRKQPALRIKKGLKREARAQFAALCYRYKKGELQILLVTSRNRGRWILPKGWPENKLTPANSALKEAFEEGGVVGTAHDSCVGVYNYSKIYGPNKGLPNIVMVYPIEVKKTRKLYPEKDQRRRKWFSPKAAAKKVDEAQLSNIIKSFDPSHLLL